MKLEKEIFINDIHSDIKFTNNNCSCSFNCIVCDGITEEELKTLKKWYKEKEVKITLEVKEPILDEEERKYLSGVIRPFRDRIGYIKKCKFLNRTEYLRFLMKGDEVSSSLPLFKKGTMYKGMELNKEYTLEKLEL